MYYLLAVIIFGYLVAVIIHFKSIMNPRQPRLKEDDYSLVDTNPKLYNFTVVSLSAYPKQDPHGDICGWSVYEDRIRITFTSPEYLTTAEVLEHMIEMGIINDTTSLQACKDEDGNIIISNRFTAEPLYVVRILGDEDPTLGQSNNVINIERHTTGIGDNECEDQ